MWTIAAHVMRSVFVPLLLTTVSPAKWLNRSKCGVAGPMEPDGVPWLHLVNTVERLAQW